MTENVDMLLDDPVEELEHEPGQVRRPGFGSLELTMCSPNCGMCTDSYQFFYGPSALEDHRKVREGQRDYYYATIDSMFTDGYAYPVR